MELNGEVRRGRLSPCVICECGARQRYLERSDMLTDLFCRFRNNTREFLLNIYKLQLFPLLSSSRRWLQKSMSGMVLAEDWWCENPQAAFDLVLAGTCRARTFFFCRFDVVTLFSKLSEAGKVNFLACHIMRYRQKTETRVLSWRVCRKKKTKISNHPRFVSGRWETTKQQNTCNVALGLITQEAYA